MKRQIVFLLLLTIIAGCKKDDSVPVVSVTGITVLPTSKTISEGETFTIAAPVSPAAAANKSVHWSSSDAAVAAVDNSGKVTGKQAGSATITAKTADGGKTATTAVTVQKKAVSVTGITVDPTSKTVTEGESFTITATVTPGNADNKSINWSSSDINIAFVDDKGKVLAKKPGVATITAATVDGNKTATTQVTVEMKGTDGNIQDVEGGDL